MNKSIMRKSVVQTAKKFFGCLVILLSGCSSQPEVTNNWQKGDYQPAIDYLDETLQTELDIGDIVGLSVALVDDQTVVWQQGFGYSDIDNDQFTTAESRYRAGIITQLFTATAIMQLVERGELKLDQPLQEILPEFKMNSRFASIEPITLRNLLDHHAGLPADLLGDRDLPFNQIMNSLNAMNMSFAPNTIMANSNIGYSLLGQVIEQASGLTYADYMAKHVFSPLQMRHSSVQVNFTGGAYSNGGAVIEPPLRDIPSAGLVTTATDLAQFAKLIHREGDGLLNFDSVAELTRVQNSERPLDLNNRNGLGFRYFERVLAKPARVVGQVGNTYAHRAIILTSLDDKFSVILLANTAEAADSLKVLATQAMHYGLAAKNGTYPGLYAQREYPRANPFELDKVQIQGDYASLAGLLQVTATKSGALKMNTLGRTLDLVPNSEGSVKPELRLMGMVSIPLGDYSAMRLYPQRVSNRQLLVGDLEGEKLLIGEKITPSAYPQSLQRFFGRWVPIEPAATVLVKIAGIQLHEKNGYLTSSLSTAAGTTLHYPLQALNEQEAVALGVGKQLGEYFKFYYENGQPRLNYSGLVFKPSGALGKVKK